jgi:membrane-associated phospholipid phosphatase
MRDWLNRSKAVFFFFLLTLFFDNIARLLPIPSVAESSNGAEVLWLQRNLPQPFFDYFCITFYILGYPFLLYVTAWVLAPNRPLFVRYLLVFSICQSLALLIWLLCPTSPPRLAVKGVRWIRGEIFGFSEYFNTFTYGAFPSMHAAHGLVSLLFVWKEKRYRKWWILVLSCMVFSSVYLGEHYLTDVLAGFVLGGAVFGLISFLDSLFNSGICRNIPESI